MKAFAPIGLLFLLLLSACGVSTQSVSQRRAELADRKQKLMQAYRHWEGTPYRIGGTDTLGVDCSSLVQQVFENRFDMELPRLTGRQMRAGYGIRRAALTTGDLVFFHTGRKVLHVGIVLNHNEFLHASTSKGVTITRLDNGYWAPRYIAARRVF